jgi:hypothetical protein
MQWRSELLISAYNVGDCEGRSRPRQEAWLSQSPYLVLRLDSTQPVEIFVRQVLATL